MRMGHRTLLMQITHPSSAAEFFDADADVDV
jgi:hypothetical protein